MSLWLPDEPSPVTVSSAPSPAQGRTSAVQIPSRAPRLDFEFVWYGLTFRGFHDDYCVSTTLALDEAMKMVHVFFTGRKARPLLEDEQRLLFSRGKWIYKYLGISDTQPPQEIDAAFQTENGVTKISIQYRVDGLGLRTPPNQLRREVIQLHTLLVGRQAPESHLNLIPPKFRLNEI